MFAEGRAAAGRQQLSTLLYCFNRAGEVLLMERAQVPNLGLWSPPGGKIDVAGGESPHQGACREAAEELGLVLGPADLHLAGLVTERSAHGSHWMMFLFEVRKVLDVVPANHREGRFGFFRREEIAALALPEADREMLWPLFWKHRGGFFAARLDIDTGGAMRWTLENHNA